MRAEAKYDLAPHVTPRLFVGLVVIALGVLFALDNLDLVEAGHVLRFWPILLVIAGLWRLVQPNDRGGRMFGLVPLVLGVVLLANELPWLGIDVDLDDLWPVLLVVIGLRLVYGAFHRGAAPRQERDVENGEARVSPTVSMFALMSGNVAKVVSQQFTGGDVGAMMGGCDLDLRRASTGGGQAVLEVFAMWGGIDIQVPEGWAVESRVLPLLGAFEDNTRPPAGPVTDRLLVRGIVLMGGIEVKHGKDEDARAGE